MRRADESPMDPVVVASLDAIDATLAGEPVDPQHAEVAELALLLASERPRPDAAFAAALDERVDRRFAKRAGSPGRRRWLFAPAAALALSAAVAVVLIVSSGGSGSSSDLSVAIARAPAAGATGSVTAESSTSASIPKTPALAPGSASAGASASTTASAGASTSAGSTAAQSTGASGPGASPQPTGNGRKVVQSASLSLAVAPTRVDDVAQQVFDVTGAQKGIVLHSTVTATGGSDGYANFQLSVPSSTLSQTMTELSGLRGANVVSRTDATQDINGQYVSAGRRLADARALRTALLKQLASADTTAEIDSLKAQIHDAEASISSDQATLRDLDRQVGYSQIALMINATATPVSHGGGPFSIGKAGHDAGRVLTVAAGVGLIALAALVPILLVGALAWWIAAAIRGRRRNQALDLA
jgi:Domain of unknown function (DUF4349)